MSQAFNLTAQINLQAPANLKTVAAEIRRELGSVNANVKLNVSQQSTKSIAAVKSRIDALNASLVQAKNNVGNLDASLRNLSSALNGVSSSTSKIDSGFTSTSRSVGQTAKNLKVATDEMEEFGKQSALAIRRFAAFSVVTTGVLSLISAVNSGFKAFVEFDKEMIKLQQVTGKGEIGLKSLENEIRNLSTSLGVSSKSLTEVASTLAQAGLSADDTRIALAALAKTELAPSFDNLTDTTEGAIAAIRQFGIEAKDLEKALGSINAVAAAFAVESKDIIAAIQRTGGVFAASSKGVSEGTAALNEFIAVFTSIRQTTRESAETIATGLRTIFTRIQRVKTIDQLREFGVELTDLEGKFVGPYEAVKRLSAALGSLDPRDLRFSQIVEELGGFRQIGKVIPLIQQFKVAQEALNVAQKGQGSLYSAQITAQKSLAVQLAKVRENFLKLIADVGKSKTFQSLFKIVIGLSSGLIRLAGAFKPILPILAIFGAIKGISALTRFSAGFVGGIRRGGGLSAAGSNLGSALSGAKEKEKSDATQKASQAIAENTTALKALTTAVNSLANNIIENTKRLAANNGTTLNSGGIVKKFATGGLVPGTGDKDTVPAMLSPGEFVIRKKAVKTIGADKLHKMNKYASGGKIVRDIAKTPGVSKQLKNAVVDSKEEPFTKGSAINSTDRLKAIIENKNITQKMVDNDLKKNKKLDSIVKNMKSSDIRTKGAAFEDYLVASKRTALKSTRDKSEIYPVDFIGNNAYAEAKNIQDPLNEDIYIDKLFRARVDDGSYSQIKQTPTSQGNQELNLGKLTVFQRAFARGGLIRKFATAGEVSSVGGQRASRSDILRVLGADKAAQAAGINSTQIYELLGLKNPDVSQQSMIDNVQKEYLKRINRKAGAAKATATKLTNKGLVFGAAGMFGKPWSANNQVIDSDKLSKKATVRIVGGVLQPEIANQIDQLFSSNIEDITSQAAQMIAPGSNAATISNPNLEGSIQGALLEKVVQKLGGPGAQKGLGFDFPEGLKAAAKYFGLPEDIPTDLKRTLSGPSTIKDNIVTYLKNVMGYARGGLVQKFAEGGSPKLVKRGTLTYKLDDIIAAGLTEEQFMEKIPVPGNMGSQWKVGGIGPDAILMPRFLTPYTPTSSVYDKWEKAQADKEERIVNAMQKKGRSVGDYEGMTTEEKIFRKNRNHGYNLGGLIKLAGGGKVDYYSLEKNSGFKSQEFDSLVNFAKTNDFTLEEFKNYLAKRLTEKRSKAGLMMNPVQLLRAITPEEPSATNRQLQLAEMLKGPVDAKYNPKYDNAIKPFSSGGSAQDTVPALLTPGEFVINKKAAQRIGYSKLHKMNKADKIQGYNKGGAVQYFNSGSTGNGVSSPISSSSGVTEKQLGLILKVLIAQEKNTRTQGGQKLINQIKDSIAKQSLGVISASEAVTTVAAGIRSFAIDQKRGGNEDRAQSLKNVFDALDRLQQSKGGTSLIQATNSQLGIGVAKKVAQAVSPSNPTTPAVINTPQTFPQQNTQVNNEAQKRKEEQNEYFAYRAKQSGQSVSGFRATLASKVVSREQELQDNLKNQQQQFRYSALGQSDILKGSKDKKQLNAAKTEFASKLKEIDPGRSAGEIDKAAKRLVIALRKGADSFDTIVKNDTVLSDILAKTRTSAENAAIAFDEVAKENNMTADVLRKQISNKDNKQYRQQKFIQSDTGQKYGKLAENAPDLISKFANTKTGQKLGAAADFASGKGLVNFATKKLGDGFGNALDGWLKKLGGPMTVLGAGLSVLGEKLPDIASSLGYGQSETAAGVAGGIAGAGQGLASGALLGGQIAGPVGALIGGVSGAIIKGITGVFNGINTKRLENNLRELDKTTTSLDLAFKKLDESSSDKNLQEANAKFAYTLTSLSKVGGQANFGAGGIARTITETLRGIDPTGLVSAVTGGETEAESRQALVSGLTRASGDADRLGPYTLSRASTSNIEQLLNSANNSTDKTTAFARANQGYQAMSRAGMGEQEIFLSKYIAQQTQQGKTSDQISKELADPKKKEAAIKQGKELLAVDGELALKQALVARTVKDLMIANEQLIEVYRKASAGLDRYSQELERFDAQASTSANDLTGNARIQPVRSQSQDVLNNISGYSRDEVAAAADEAASIAGGGDSGSKLKNDIMTSKILKDELPKALRGANGTDDVIDKLEEAFKNMQVPFPDSLKKQLSEGLSSKTVGNREGSTSMSDLADEAGSIVEEIFKGPEAGLKFAQELLTKYNETINKSIGKLEEYNDMLSKSEDWQRKAVNIRLTAELDLARALGKSPALEELNNPVDVEMKSMTSSLIPGGSTDPTAIANAMQSAKSQSSDIEKRLQNPTLEAYGVKTEGERVEAIKKDIEALGKQKKALNDGNRALEKLATDGTKAANALSKIQERQQLGENVRSLGRKLLTSDSTELADFSRQMGAYNRVISGKASNRDLSSLQTRRDAFAGLDNLKGLIPENMIKQMDAKLQRQMIMANPNGAKILNQKLGITGVNGEEMTYDDALKMGEAGKDPVQEKYIKMYQDATDVQSRAAQALADNALKSSEILRDAASQLLDKMLQLGEILPKAQESATNKPEPAPEQPQPTGAVSGEASRNQDRVLNPPSNNSNTADAVKATAAASALAGGAAYVAPRAIKSTRSTIDAAMQTVGIKPNNTATAVKQAKDTATAAKRTKNAVTTAKRATTAVRAGTGGLTAAAAPLIAANTGLSILTEGAEALYDPGAYDANKRAKVEAGQASVSNRTNVGFAGDMTSGALEGFVDPASKIVEGVYTTRALGADIDSAQQRAAKTRRMEANSRSSTYGISGQQVALANDEASLKMKLEEATSSKDDVKKAELQKELEKLNKRKTEAGARSNNWFSANTDRKEYTAAVNDIIAKRKAEAAAASATNKSATEQDKKSVETTTTAQAQNNEQKTEIQTKKAADETTKVESKETSVITVLEKILAALIDMKQNKVSLGSISASTMQTSQIPTTSAVTESQKYAGSPESPQTAETTNQLNVGQAQTSVTPAAKTIADLTAKQSYRFRQLMMKGKLRASEDGLPIGRTSAEEEEYTALAQQKKDANPQIAAKIRERELKNKGKLRVSEEGLPVGRSPEEEKEYGQMLANKPMTPYQQAQKSKREAYLARFRPEVRERMMTEEEKAVSRLAATTNVQGVSTPNNELGLAQDGTFSVPLKPQSKDFLLEREKFESYTDVQNRIARASALQIGSGPIPTSLPTQQTSTSSTTPNSENKGGISGTGYSITLDENSRKFLETFSTTINSFGNYMNQLSEISTRFKDKIEVTGDYTVQVNLSGAAAIEALDKKMKEMAESIVSKSDFDLFRSEVHRAVPSVKDPATKGRIKTS